MSEPDLPSIPATPRRFIWRLIGRPHWPKLFFAGLGLVALLALFFVRESRRVRQPNPTGGGGVPAQAERAVAARFIPTPVPDEQNFAATPFLASLFDKSIQTGASQWPDDFERADQWPKRLPVLAESVEGRKTGRLVTDLAAWQKAFEQSISGINGEEIVVSDPVDPATNAQAASLVLSALQPYQPALAELRVASRRPFSRFQVRYDEEAPWAILLPQLAVVKRTVQLLRLKTSAELAAGHAPSALDDVTLMLRLADSSKDEPMLISQLVRAACWSIAVQPIWEGLAGRHWSDAPLQTLQTRLEQCDFLASLKRVLDAERAWGNVTIGLVRDKRTPELLQSLTGNRNQRNGWQREADLAFTKCPRDWFDQEQRNYNRLFEERLLTGFDAAARRVFPRVAEENAHLMEKDLKSTSTLLENHLVFARTFLIAPGKVHLKLANAQATADLAVVACALERWRLAHGQYPESLAALAPRLIQQLPRDLVTGQPLHYQRTDDGQFVLYSVGWNETDDGGEPAFLPSGRSTEPKEGDWVWRYPARK